MNSKNKTQKLGQVIRVGGVHTWGHEDFSADALARDGYIIKFVPAHNSFRSADGYINNTLFEFKSPNGSNISCVENIVKKALKNQSKCVVVTSIRIKKVTDRSIENRLRALVNERLDIKRLYFVNRHGKVIYIKNKL